MLLEEFSTIFDRPEKIKKLREYILSLAVKGKLVEQDENDEPASVLLERIREEKDRLVKEKKIKKEKPLLEISNDEVPYELPKGWEWVRLGDYTQINPRNNIDDDLDTSFVPMKLIDDGFSNVHTFEIKKWSEIKKGFTHFAERDVVVAKITPCFENRKSVVIKNLANGIGAGTTELYVVRSFEELILPEYILNVFKTNEFIKGGVGTYTGTAGQQRVKKDYVTNLVVGIPPLNEQKRIVEKVDYLMEFCDKLEAQLEKKVKYGSLSAKSVLNSVSNCSSYEELEEALIFIIENFKDLTLADGAVGELKNAILSLAVKGKLVPQDDSEEPASVLLERIREEKDMLVKEKKRKKEKLLPEISEDEIPYELPKGWKWVRLGEVSQLLGGNAFKSTSYVENSDNQVIRLGNVKNDYLILDSKDVYIDDKLAEESLSYKIIEDDLLVTMTGTRGKRDYFYTCLVENKHLTTKNLFLNQRVGLIRVLYSELSKYLNVSLKSKDVLDIIFETETGTANQGNIGAKSVNNLIVPLPPLKEQKRIIGKVEMLMEACNKLELRIERSKKYSENMMESILKNSFKA